MCAVVCAIDIDCHNASTYSIANAPTLTPLVTFRNCSQRILVNIAACGTDATSPLTIEVVGGITVPMFNLIGCSDGGVGNAIVVANITFLIRGVWMPYEARQPPQLSPYGVVTLTQSDFTNPMDATLFSFSAASLISSIALVVVDSRLTWVCTAASNQASGGTPFFLRAPEGAVVRGANVTVHNTSLLGWSDTPWQRAISFESASRDTIIIIRSSTVMLSFHRTALSTAATSASSSVIRLFDAVDSVVVHVDSSTIMWDAAASIFASISIVEVGYGQLMNGTFRYDDSNISVVVGRTVRLIDLSTTTQVAAVNVTIDHCHCEAALAMADATLTAASTAQLGIYVFGVATSPSIVNMTTVIRDLTFQFVIDYRALSQPLPGTMTVATVGTHSIVSFSGSGMNSCVVNISRTTGSFEEMGRISVAPLSLAVCVVTSSFALMTLYDGLATFVATSVIDSAIAVTRDDVLNSSLVVAPSVGAGVFIGSSSIVLVFGSLSNSSLTLINCMVNSTIAFSNDALVPVWGGVGLILQGALLNYFATDLAPYLKFIAARVQMSPCYINASTIRVVASAVIVNPSSLFTAALTIVPRALRWFVVLASLSNMFNASITLSGSSVTHTLATVAQQRVLGTAECFGAVSVAPSSTLAGVAIQVDTMTSWLPSVLCACGLVTISDVCLVIRNLLLRGDGSSFASDALQLAPISAAFPTALHLFHFSIRIAQMQSTGIRSVLGNVTDSVALVGKHSNNIAIAYNPIVVTMSNCVSNEWNSDVMTCADLLRPVDGRQHVAWSLLDVAVEDSHDNLCARCTTRSASRSFTAQAPPPSGRQTNNLLETVATIQGVTTAVLGVAMATSSSGAGASIVPMLQGMSSALKLTSRCAVSPPSSTGGGAQPASNSNENDGGTSSLGSSSYAADDFGDNPLLVHLPTIVAPSLSFATGALVGNTLLVLVIGVISHMLSFLNDWRRRRAVQEECANSMRLQFSHPRDADTDGNKTEAPLPSRTLLLTAVTVCCRFLPTTRLPGSLLRLQGLLLQPVIAAAVACVVNSDRNVGSVALAVVIGLPWIAVPCVFMWLLQVKHAPLPLVTIPCRRVDSKYLRWERVGRALEWLCAEQGMWVAAGRYGKNKRSRTSAAHDIMKTLGVVFEGYRSGRHWYFGVDVLTGVVTGAVVGAAESVVEEHACTAAIWGTVCVGAVSALNGVLCGVLRPHTVRCELLVTVSVSMLTAIAEAILLAGDAEASGTVSVVASIVGLLSLVAGLAWKACLSTKTTIVSTTKDFTLQDHNCSSIYIPLSSSVKLGAEHNLAKTQRRQPPPPRTKDQQSKTSAPNLALPLRHTSDSRGALILLLQCICEK